MMEEDDDLLSLSSNEMRELVTEARRFGASVGEHTAAWLVPFWQQVGLPVHQPTGKPFWTSDVSAHATAVTILCILQQAGLGEHMRHSLPSLDDALRHFTSRVTAGDGRRYFTDEGMELLRQVLAFRNRFLVPIPGTAAEEMRCIAAVNQTPGDEGLQMLAELLMQFRDVSFDTAGVN